MKLKDKKTGEPITFKVIQTDCECLDEHEADTLYGEPITLETLNKYCEDYEEPKVFYYIKSNGYIVKDNDTITKDFADDLESIGNYFETEEEAEKAVEKLKAWERLKEDINFEFESWSRTAIPFGQVICVRAMCDDAHVTMKKSKQLYRDLDLLFGGEE